jgi:Tfp pilus assembly protein PilW
MVEVLISLAILGILLTAIATAFNASAMNYRENSSIAEAIGSGRAALDKMTSLIRTSGNISTASEGASACSLVTADSHDITFSYNSTQKKLYYVTNYSTTDVDPVLCDNVTAMTFTKTLGKDSKGVDCVKSVVMTITVTVGKTSETLTAAAVVRPNL